MVKIKRIYDEYEHDDGYRVLVDRLWSRGISKAKSHIDLWMKDIAPSTELRKWFGHDPERWKEFEKRYRNELMAKKEMTDELKTLKNKHKTLTLLYAARDTEHNEAVILLELLKKR